MPTETVQVELNDKGIPIVGIKDGKQLGYARIDSKWWGVELGVVGDLRAAAANGTAVEVEVGFGKLGKIIKSIANKKTVLAAAADRVVAKAAERPATNARDRRDIFIDGGFNSALRASLQGRKLDDVTTDEMAIFLDKLDLLWRSKKYLGREQTPFEEAMDDEVPY